MTATIEVPPVEGFWGPANEIGLGWSNWDDRKKWLQSNLSKSQQRLAACAFARRVLHMFQSRHPEDNRPRTAIETAELFALGLATSEELSNSRFAAAAAAAYAAYVAAAAASDAAAYADAAAASDAAAYADAAAASYAAASYAASADAGAAERLAQARMLTLFSSCDSVISESSKGLANRWIHSYLDHGIDSKGIREVLADSLQDDGVPEDRCQWVRHVEQWHPGMWPMTLENFTRGEGV